MCRSGGEEGEQEKKNKEKKKKERKIKKRKERKQEKKCEKLLENSGKLEMEVYNYFEDFGEKICSSTRFKVVHEN